MLSRDLYTSSLMPRAERTSDDAPRRPWDRPVIWWSLAAGALILGYVDLARGGETIAPVLLVLGYCVLVPVAILRG